ncbi:MAG: dioxygenase [Chitinophagaceae bacterium]|nr:MAG: dioxygenase [Chitinophagaceae bacterium]
MNTISKSPRMPVLFVPHGGGPMPLLDEPNHRGLTAFMRHVIQQLPRPKVILMISAHWEEDVATISSGATPAMIYDYHGFPPETYRYIYPAPGDAETAKKLHDVLIEQGVAARLDPQRGYDHGTFVPLMLMYPGADIPVVQLSLLNSFDPAAHINIGKALSSLRDDGVLIIGSGMSFHNMQAFFSGKPDVKGRSEQFDVWLTHALTDETLTSEERERILSRWEDAPQARFSHPREEHLLPLYVCFGAASQSSQAAEKVFSGLLFDTYISAFLWR